MPPAGGRTTLSRSINLRKGGTTHPYAALRNLVPGRYDLESGRWVCTDGSERAYQATDSVLDDALAGGQVVVQALWPPSRK